MILTCLVSLQIPLLSMGIAAFAVTAFILWAIICVKKLPAGFIYRLLLLLGFVLVYETSAAGFGFISVPAAFGYGFLIFGLYGVGYVMGRHFQSWNAVMWIALSSVVGFVAFAFLSTLQEYGAGAAKLEEFYKPVPGIWGTESINRPGIGSMASLGICFFPSLLFLFSQRKSVSYALILCLSATASLGLLTNAILANRTPFIALGVTFVMSAVLLISSGSLRIRLKIIAVTAFATLLSLLIYYFMKDYFQSLYIVTRFLDEGLDTTGRWDSWAAMLSGLLEYQSGGRSVYIAGNSYVHNLWLDVAWDAGTIAFILLVLFHASHVRVLFASLRNSIPNDNRLVFLGVMMSILVNFMQEPTMAASQIYFYFSCWLLGLIYSMRRARSFRVL